MWMYYSMADDEKIYRVGLARQTLVPPR